MDPDALLLARIQFGFTISVHIIFPAFSIGSSAFVATLLVLWRRTGSDHYHRIARFWTKIFRRLVPNGCGVRYSSLVRAWYQLEPRFPGDRQRDWTARRL
jgi:hypothetical protein